MTLFHNGASPTHSFTSLFKKRIHLSVIAQSFTNRHFYFKALSDNMPSSFTFFTPKPHFRMAVVTAVICLISESHF